MLEQNKICLPVHDSFIGLLTQRQSIIQAMEQAYSERFNKAITFNGKDLFMTNADGSAKYPRQFPLPFNVDGSINHSQMQQMFADSIHSQYVRSYWRQSASTLTYT